MLPQHVQPRNRDSLECRPIGDKNAIAGRAQCLVLFFRQGQIA
jgi:hypothetical protein